MGSDETKTMPTELMEGATVDFDSLDDMANGRPTRYAITESGQVKPKASPELLPVYLRNLPGELVTKEVDEEKKVHAEDAPHIIGALVSDYAKSELGLDKVGQIDEPTPPDAPDDDYQLTQAAVDVRRLNVMRTWANTQKLRILKQADGQPPYYGVIWLYFPENDHRAYEMRYGNPPSDRDRPKHLRGLRLEIDILAGLPDSVIDRLRSKGIQVTSVYEDLVRKSLNHNVVLDADGNPWQ